MKAKLLTLAFILTIFSTAISQETNSPGVFGKGIFNLMGQDSTWSMKVGARAQILTTAAWVKGPDGLTDSQTSFSIRRARIKMDGFILSPKLVYKIELSLSNRDVAGLSETNQVESLILRDVVIKWNFYENFVLWAGLTKLPGNVERVISSGNLQLVNRSLLN